MNRKAVERGLEAGGWIRTRMIEAEEERTTRTVEAGRQEGRGACEKYANSCPLQTWNQAVLPQRQKSKLVFNEL